MLLMFSAGKQCQQPMMPKYIFWLSSTDLQRRGAGIAAFLINIASSGFIKFRYAARCMPAVCSCCTAAHHHNYLTSCFCRDKSNYLHKLPAALLAAPLAAGLAYYAFAHVRWIWHIIGPVRQTQAGSHSPNCP